MYTYDHPIWKSFRLLAARILIIPSESETATKNTIGWTSFILLLFQKQQISMTLSTLLYYFVLRKNFKGIKLQLYFCWLLGKI
jgi:hypothetical protein